MCTVSFIPVEGKVYLTSNRDERSTRLSAKPPLVYKHENAKLLYPKDGDKGGTWIAVSQNGDAGVLLNGAASPHTPKHPYRFSRGLILPQILSAADPADAFSKFEANDIEPFTLVLYVQKTLYECRWNGELKSINRLPVNQPHIWSSCTLYTPEIQENRKRWFDQWVTDHPSKDAESIYRLHRFGADNNERIDLVMNRNNEMLTVSITSIQLDAAEAVMTYYELKQNNTYRNSLRFFGQQTAGASLWWRRFSIRLRHWEYWPFHAVYAPIYPYWFWLCLKARSFFFFTASNPTIRNGGFLMESKKEIYDLMPVGSYPKTRLISKGEMLPGDVRSWLARNGLSFPLIAKPDIGLRGLAVKLLRNVEDLDNYHTTSKVDYLLQAYVPFENEVGVFYCRMPGTEKGTVTGVVGKQLLTVTGDGVQTVGELLSKEKRFVLQLDALRRTLPVTLTQVLPGGETKLVVPYGNHCRGAKFIDQSHLVNDALVKTIDNLCSQIPGFHFGRLDIRYSSWEELCSGRNFCVIELNGAGSEPAHIYDPKHSIFFGWREIIRHLDLLYRISKQNKLIRKVPYLAFKDGVNLFRENARYLRKIS